MLNCKQKPSQRNISRVLFKATTAAQRNSQIPHSKCHHSLSDPNIIELCYDASREAVPSIFETHKTPQRISTAPHDAGARLGA